MKTTYKSDFILFPKKNHIDLYKIPSLVDNTSKLDLIMACYIHVKVTVLLVSGRLQLDAHLLIRKFNQSVLKNDKLLICINA